MLFSYMVGHVPVNFRKTKNEKVIKKIQILSSFYTHPLVREGPDISFTGYPALMLSYVEVNFLHKFLSIG